MTGRWPCVSGHDGAWRLDVSVVPNAGRTAADGLHDGALRVRLAAPPVDGRANELLVAWVAKGLGRPRRAVRLAGGDTSRRKRLVVDCDGPTMTRWLDGLLAPPP